MSEPIDNQINRNNVHIMNSFNSNPLPWENPYAKHYVPPQEAMPDVSPFDWHPNNGYPFDLPKNSDHYMPPPEVFPNVSPFDI